MSHYDRIGLRWAVAVRWLTRNRGGDVATRRGHPMTSATEKTLREKLIEAMAKAYHNNDPAYAPPYWDDCYPHMKMHYRSVSTAALDALLDYLTENTEEWSAVEVELHKKLGGESAWHSRHEDELAHLIAVLREELTDG